MCMVVVCGLVVWRIGLAWPCDAWGLALFVSVFARFSVINRATFFLINETGKAFASCFEKKTLNNLVFTNTMRKCLVFTLYLTKYYNQIYRKAKFTK